MSAVECCSQTNQIHGNVGWRAVDDTTIQWLANRTPVRKPIASTTTTAPPPVPQPLADCFDLDYVEPWIVYSKPFPALLSFDEFAGLAPNMPLLVTVEYRCGLCEIEHPDLGLYGRGETCEEAMVDFLEYLAADYQAYAEESDDKLDSHALELARRYRRLLRKL